MASGDSGGTPESRLKLTLYIGGLAPEVDESALFAAFIPFGEIRHVEIPKDRATSGHRGFGFVAYESEEDAFEAQRNMDGAELYGRSLRVNSARTVEHAPGTRGKAIWHDDLFFRQEMDKQGLPISNSLDKAPDA